MQQAVNIVNVPNQDIITPICSDNESDQDLDCELDFLPSISPGAKYGYMPFPDNNNQETKIVSTKSAHLNSGYSSLSSFDINIADDLQYENLQHQQTDIFCSQNQFHSEGIYNHKSIGTGSIIDGEPITMMGYIENDSSLHFKDIIPGQWRSKIYSEGNIAMHPHDEQESDASQMTHIEGINTKDDMEDMEDMDDDEKFCIGNNYTLLGEIHTNYQHEDQDMDEEEEEDDCNHKQGVTLLGGVTSEQISFDIEVENMNGNKEEELRGITLIGHIEDDTNLQYLPFNHQQLNCNHNEHDKN